MEPKNPAKFAKSISDTNSNLIPTTAIPNIVFENRRCLRFFSTAATSILATAATTFLLAAAAGTFSVPCYAQDGPGTPSLEENMKEQLKDQYAVKGNYAISYETGDIFYSEDSQTFFSSGIGGDGCIYDEEGKQKNTLSCIKDKYIGQFEAVDGSEPSGILTFDSADELLLFIDWFQLEHMDHQGERWFYSERTHLDGTKEIQIMKSEFEKRESEPGEVYRTAVDGIISQVRDADLSISDMSTCAQTLVAKAMVYDSAYRGETMDKAISDGKGVCYHYVKMMKDVLSGCGVESEILYGEVIDDESDDDHVWLRVWDSDNNKWIYRDPTRASGTIRNGLFSVDIYDVYANSYRQAGITG